MSAGRAITVNGETIGPGTRATLDIVAGKLYTHEPVYMPVHVINGRRAGPVLFVSAAIHGDELNGIEIVRRLLALSALNRLQGTLIAVPIVNVLGVVHQSRYLPDRRDLNRSFPGSERGSLAARMAYLFIDEVVAHASHGIDLHTGAIHRSNLPQIRADLEDPEVLAMARAFGAPVAMQSNLRDGSLRASACDRGIKTLLYEAGEALRFDEVCIRVGVRGVINVMRSLGMLKSRPRGKRTPPEPVIARSSSWVRAPASGIFRATCALGASVQMGDVLGIVSDPFGEDESPLETPYRGIVIGRSNLPLVHEGEALYHIGRFDRQASAAADIPAQIDALSEESPMLPGEQPIV